MVGFCKPYFCHLSSFWDCRGDYQPNHFLFVFLVQVSILQKTKTKIIFSHVFTSTYGHAMLDVDVHDNNRAGSLTAIFWKFIKFSSIFGLSLVFLILVNKNKEKIYSPIDISKLET